MKKLLLVTTPMLLIACVQHMPTMPTQIPAQSSLANLPTETPRQGQYIALPGQAAVDTDAAFEQQVAAYNNPSPQPVVIQQPVAGAAESALNSPVPAMVPTSPAIVNPTATAGFTNPMEGLQSQVNNLTAGAASLAGGAADLMQGTNNTSAGALVDYTLRITNATPGRVYIEAQDAAGEIYPCGFMAGSQSISSEKKQVAPIKGPITVVVRDPDKDGAPELRRYKVTPPTGYAGKTLEITIISGGFYQVSVDGQVRYITPTPVGKPDLGNAASTSPAEAAAAEAAKAPAAPDQTPAGI